jgi:hypothetical protein
MASAAKSATAAADVPPVPTDATSCSTVVTLSPTASAIAMVTVTDGSAVALRHTAPGVAVMLHDEGGGGAGACSRRRWPAGAAAADDDPQPDVMLRIMTRGAAKPKKDAAPLMKLFSYASSRSCVMLPTHSAISSASGAAGGGGEVSSPPRVRPAPRPMASAATDPMRMAAATPRRGVHALRSTAPPLRRSTSLSSLSPPIVRVRRLLRCQCKGEASRSGGCGGGARTDEASQRTNTPTRPTRRARWGATTTDGRPPPRGCQSGAPASPLRIGAKTRTGPPRRGAPQTTARAAAAHAVSSPSCARHGRPRPVRAV